jgi:methylthioribulose 1-phosphate dehydratase/enolase-phosphatase E1
MPPRKSKPESAAAKSKAPAAASEAPSSSSLSDSYPSIAEAKKLVAELCASFYRLGWVSGTGGGLSMRAGSKGESVVMAPSGVQKERMTADDMFVLKTADGEVVETPRSSTAARPLKLSECAPLFMSVSSLVF